MGGGVKIVFVHSHNLPMLTWEERKEETIICADAIDVPALEALPDHKWVIEWAGPILSPELFFFSKKLLELPRESVRVLTMLTLTSAQLEFRLLDPETCPFCTWESLSAQDTATEGVALIHCHKCGREWLEKELDFNPNSVNLSP